MTTLDVTWRRSEEGLADVFGFGDELRAFIQNDALQTSTAALKAILEIETGAARIAEIAAVTGVVNPVTAVLALLIDNLRKRIEDVRKTGIYMLPIGLQTEANTTILGGSVTVPTGITSSFSTSGGLNGVQRYIRKNLRNRRDPARPNFSEEAYVGGFGFIAFGLDKATLDKVKDLITKGFFSDAMTRRKAGLETFAATTDLTKVFTSAYEANRIALTARPIPDSPWIFTNVGKMLPASVFNDPLIALEGLLVGILAILGAADALFKKFLSFVQATLKQIEDLIRILNDVIELLDLLFLRFPLAIFSFEPQLGGTKAIEDSLSDWFSSARPQLNDVPDNSFMVGLFTMFGAPGLSEVQVTRDILGAIVSFS